MDETSVTRPLPPSTRAIVADEAFCAQAAALLMCDRQPILEAFLGEPAEEVLEMVRWALCHEDDEGFDPAKTLAAWARKRGRGAWRQDEADGTARNGQHHPEGSSPDGEEGLPGGSDGSDAEREAALRIARYWEAHPERLAEALRWPHDQNGRS
ncbi:MAG: hypothetical protein M3R38_19050 [Actinomycetota bacterium]|nr:hypothetical protein [Actinomycetota bacterium]MDP9486578.1 hypothetical protein [Actinomycetota bacterium]